MIRTITLAALLLASASFADAQGLFSSRGRSGSLIQDRRPPRAASIGDILTVLVLESTSATNRSQVETSKDASVDWNSGKALGFIPGFTVGSNASNEYTGEGSTVREQQISARVSVSVVDVRPNGDLVIEGSRVIDINGEQEVIYLSGSVNPLIIPATNTIESYRVADLQISYKGKGALTETSRPGFIVRLFNWVF